jgi:hypothetical protein
MSPYTVENELNLLGREGKMRYAFEASRPMPKKMRFSESLILATAMVSSVSSADEVGKPVVGDDSMASVLKPEGFALSEKLGDVSEAGQDHAFRLQAAATNQNQF